MNILKVNKKEYLTRTKVDILFYFLIVSDIVLIGLHCLAKLDIITQYKKYLLLTTERGIPEIFQHVKELSIFIVLLFVFYSRKNKVFLIWAILFAYLFADDFFSIHENVGYLMAQKLNIPSALGLRPQDFGELLVSGIVGGLLLIPLIIGFKKSSVIDKMVSKILFILLLVLIFFGIVVDMIQISLTNISFWENLMAVVEDGGEMITMSLILWYLLNIDYYNNVILNNK